MNNALMLKSNSGTVMLTNRENLAAALIFFGVFCSGGAMGQGASSGQKSKFDLGWAAASGNTDTTTVKAELDAKFNGETSKHNLIVKALSSRQEVIVEDADGESTRREESSVEKYIASLRNVYNLDDKNAGLFLLSGYDHDRFSDYAYQAVIAAGYQNRWFENANSSFDYSIGLGLARKKLRILDQSGNEVGQQQEKATVTRVDFDYIYNLSEDMVFKQSLESDISVDSGDNSKTTAITSITVSLNQTFSLKISHTLTHNNNDEDLLRWTDVALQVQW